MSAERRKVLEMLALGKITAEDAEKLLDKLAASGFGEAEITGIIVGLLVVELDPAQLGAKLQSIRTRLGDQQTRAGSNLA